MLITVDRIESDRAILEVAGETVEIPAAALPPGAGEGSTLCLQVAAQDDRLSAATARLDRLKASDTAPDSIDL